MCTLLLLTISSDGGSWGNIGLSCLVGLATPIWCFIGPDGKYMPLPLGSAMLTSIVAGAHMSEELKDASLQLPKAMMWATFGNGIMGICMLITFWSVCTKAALSKLPADESKLLHYRPRQDSEWIGFSGHRRSVRGDKLIRRHYRAGHYPRGAGVLLDCDDHCECLSPGVGVQQRLREHCDDRLTVSVC